MTSVPTGASERKRLRALTDLEGVQLTHANQRIFAEACLGCGGPPAWRARKVAEARAVLALSQFSGRYAVGMLDLSDAVRILIHMAVPVPVRPHPAAPVAVVQGAVLGLTYRLIALSAPQPGMSFVQVLAPNNILHPNVLADATHAQLICLGPKLPASIRVPELIKICYGALSMQLVQLNPGDAAGVLNGEAAEYWQGNIDKLPLTREPFARTPNK